NQADPAKNVVLLWNTYNSRDLHALLPEKTMNYSELPRAFHKFFENVDVCWNDGKCSNDKRETCPAFMNDDNRCWVVKGIAGQDVSSCERCDTKKKIETRLHIES
nr:hypothetical protein [Candidatus Sigynarchaeota archaeon]